MATKAPKETYTRNARVISVHDGDTVVLDVDLGLEIYRVESCRLNGIDAPELSTPAGKVTAKWLKDLLPAGTQLVVQTVKGKEREKFGRYLAELFVPGAPLSVNALMVEQGLAKPYFGGAKT